MANNAELIAVGADGAVIRTTTGGGTCSPPVATEDAPGTSTFMPSAAPSPSSGLVTVSFTLARPESARLTVHDALGRAVAVVTDALLAAGPHAVQVDTRSLPPGLYVVRLVTDDGRATARVGVVR